MVPKSITLTWGFVTEYGGITKVPSIITEPRINVYDPISIEKFVQCNPYWGGLNKSHGNHGESYTGQYV